MTEQSPERPPADSSRPKFSSEDRRDLRNAGLTSAQVQALERDLPEISDWVHKPSAFRDVANVLAELGHELREAERHLRRAQAILEASDVNPSIRTPRRVAVGHLRIEAAKMYSDGSLEALAGQSDADASEVLPQRIDPLLLTRALVAACERAGAAFPAAAQSMRRTKAPAIAIIERSLARPTDAASAAVVQKMPVSRAADAPFLRVAEIVFSALGAPTGPANPIRELLAQRAAIGGGSDGRLSTLFTSESQVTSGSNIGA